MFWIKTIRELKEEVDVLNRKVELLSLDNDKLRHSKHIGKEATYIKQGESITFEVEDFYIDGGNVILTSGIELFHGVHKIYPLYEHEVNLSDCIIK